MFFKKQISLWSYVLGAALVLTSCSTPKRLDKLEQDVNGLLNEVQATALPAKPAEQLQLMEYQPYGQGDSGGGEHEVLRLNLRSSLELAAKYSREYQTSKETLYNSALTLKSVSHDWDWNPVNSLSALWNVKQDPSSSILSSNSSLGLKKYFLTGARLTANIGLQTLRYFSGDRSVNLTSLANLTVSQPLLAGYGADIAREPLTQAERNLIYALRNYVRAREALLISIAERYYAVLNSRDALEIGKQTYTSVASSLERSEAMAEAGRVDPFQVDQARQKVLTAESNLVSLNENYQSALDNLKTALGLPLESTIEADPEDLARLTAQQLATPPMDFSAAIAIALQKRLDYATVKDRLQDAQRQVKIAEDAMRAKLTLTAGANAASNTGNSLRPMDFADSDYYLGLDLDLPFDRTNEAINLQRRRIALRQQQRSIDESKDIIIGDLRNIWRQLKSYEQSYEIQRISVNLAEKRVESTQLLFEGGRVDIRELLDAQDDLSSAKNSLTRALVNHRICWLKLLYQLGELPIDPVSLWSDTLEVAG
ncbi:MAG: TolC family protein [Lentisphaerae bacterium]|nr:TolC family protein [Lentisphaerota bacterium]